MIKVLDHGRSGYQSTVYSLVNQFLSRSFNNRSPVFSVLTRGSHVNGRRMQVTRKFSATLTSVLLTLALAITIPVVATADITVGGSCSAELPDSKFLNPSSCRSYFVCTRGRYELAYCPSGFFNPAKSICDVDYQCRLDNLPEENTPPNILTTVFDDWISSSTYSTTVTNDGGTTTWGASSTTFPESGDTTESATSVPTVEPLPTVDITTATGALPTTSLMISTTTTSPDPNSCPATDTEEPTFLADKQTCDKFYLCYHSRPIEMHCVSGMYWNPDTQMCDYAQNVNCPVDGSNPDAYPLPKCTLAGLYNLPHPSRCDYFLMCMDGEQTIQQCEAFHRWDVVAQKCMIKDRATCILDITNPGLLL